MLVDNVRQLFEQVKYSWGENGSLTGEIVLADESIRSIVNELISLGVISDRFVPKLGRPLAKEFSSLNESDYNVLWKITFNTTCSELKIFKTVDDLAGLHPVHPPKSFVLLEEEGIPVVLENAVPDGAPAKLVNYVTLTKIWRILEECSQDYSTNTITFLYKCKLELNNKYPIKILEKGFDGYTKFNDLFSDKDGIDNHRTEKVHILQSTLVAFFDSSDLDSRFSKLLSNFDKFVLRLDEAYQAFVVGFSFDKLREQHEEKYREFMVAINDVISATLLKSLMIPTGIFLIATRTQSIVSKSSFEEGMLHQVSNAAVGLAVITISIVFYILLNSEAYSISAIKFEYKSLMGRLKEKSAPAFEAIVEHEKRLSARIEFAEKTIEQLHFINLLFAVIAVVWVLFYQFPISLF